MQLFKKRCIEKVVQHEPTPEGVIDMVELYYLKWLVFFVSQQTSFPHFYQKKDSRLGPVIEKLFYIQDQLVF